MISLSTCPVCVIRLNPPSPSMPALFETAVSECNDLPRARMAFMIVSATPQRPKPALRMVDPDRRSATAVSAESKSFCERSFRGALLYFRVCERRCAHEPVFLATRRRLVLLEGAAAREHKSSNCGGNLSASIVVDCGLLLGTQNHSSCRHYFMITTRRKSYATCSVRSEHLV